MKLRPLACAAVCLLALTEALAPSAHAAQPLYATLDRLFIKPKLPLPVLTDQTRFEILVYHAYPTPLHHLRVAAESQWVEVDSDELAELKPTLIETLSFRARLKEKPAADRITVDLRFLADEFDARDAVAFTIPLSEPAANEANAEAALPVGEIRVNVTPLSALGYWSYLVVTAAVVVLVVWRRRRAGW